MKNPPTLYQTIHSSGVNQKAKGLLAVRSPFPFAQWSCVGAHRGLWRV